MADSAQTRPLRSCLFMPASNARAMEKARSLPADCLIFDLEDAVAPESKTIALDTLIARLNEGGDGARYLVVRTNGLGSETGAAEIAALANAPVDALLLPKVSSRSDVEAVQAMLDKAGSKLRLWAMVETAKCIININEIAAMATASRLDALVVGLNDLGVELKASMTGDRVAFLHALSATVMAARAHGLVAIDAVYNGIAINDEMEDQMRQGHVLGFDGKSLIHPNQLAPANRIFGPSPQEIEDAQAIVTAFDEPANAGKGAINLGNRMVERLHLEQARSVLAMAERIRALGH